MKKAILTILLLIGITPAAYADCIYNGKPYPTGKQIGGFECQADGTWKPLNPGVEEATIRGKLSEADTRDRIA